MIRKCKIPLSIFIIMLFSINLFSEGKVGVVVNKDLWNSVKGAVEGYVADVEKIEKKTVWLEKDKFNESNTCEELKADIKAQFTSGDLEGVVLIGDLPIASYNLHEKDFFGGEFQTRGFPTDLFYMDMDGSWSGSNGSYSGHSGNKEGEIWISRITASVLENHFDDEVTMVNEYLARVKARMYGQDEIPFKYVIAGQNQSGHWPSLENNNMGDLGYGQANTDTYGAASIGDAGVAKAWKESLVEGREYGFVYSHSSPTSHAIGFGISDQVSEEMNCRFFNSFACSNALYTTANMCGGYALADKGLVCVGSTRTGSMYPGTFPNYNSPLGNGDCFGEAFRKWFNKSGLSNPSWHYGMTLQGVGTLVLEKYVSGPFISVSNPATGAEYIVGAKIDIIWSSNIDKVSLYLVKGSTVAGTIAENIDNNGNYSWDIPLDTDGGTDYKIQMKGDTVTSESDVFTIKKKPSIALSTNEIAIGLLQSSTGDMNLKISNKGEGELRYSVALISGSASLLINEVYVPYSSFADGFEIWNRGTECDLKGYKIEWKDNAGSSGSHTFADSYLVKEGETFVLADEKVSGKCITVDNLAWGNTGDDITELSIVIYDPNGKCVDYVKTAGSNDTPPQGQWDGAGLQTGSERLFRNKNEDGNSASDWSSADGKESINEINPGQTMDGVGKYRLIFSPKEGTVDAVSDIDLKLTFDSEGLENGDYYDTLEITHDDPDTQSPIVVYCKLTVGVTSISNTIKSISKANIAWLGNRILYQIPEKMNNKKLSIKLYNAQGKMIRTLVNGPAESGYHTIRLDRTSSGLQEIATGFYLCRMTAKGFTKTITIIATQ